MKPRKIDKAFLFLSLTLIGGGILIFYSAALGFASRRSLDYSSIIFNQLFIGLLMGTVCAFILFAIRYKFLKKVAPWLFLLSLIVICLVFTPLGYEYNGARRWISIAGQSVQPTELLKIASIIFFSAWISKFQKRNEKTAFGVISLALILGVSAIPLIFQPDFDAIILIAIPLFTILVASRAPFKYIFYLAGVGFLAIMILGLSFSHVRERVTSFFNMSEDARGGNYQVQQALIAVGSGEITGRGFGQSVQKFKYLPEPAGDSIFAVYAEETGFIGGVFLIILYTLWALRGYKISTQMKDNFAKYFIVGSVTLIIFQSFLNIAAMVGLLPIVGLPLVFISQGGTALLINMCIVAIILDMSSEAKV